MSQISPTLPVVGGDTGLWGGEVNAALAALISQGNASDTALSSLLPLLPPAGTASGSVLTANGVGGTSYAPLPAGVTAAQVLAAQSQLVGINTLAAAYTLVLGDAGKQVEYNSASPAIFTVPANSAVAFPVGTVITFYLAGTGALTISPASGVTITSPSGFRLTTQYATASIVQRAANAWVLSGFTVA